ncbi:hypothetical protein FB451DRAFT_1170009 [Mycena latifolia]|nr:hypothetical protein FB451DRAFT_1170009 [Mycena latifolia]
MSTFNAYAYGAVRRAPRPDRPPVSRPRPRRPTSGSILMAVGDINWIDKLAPRASGMRKGKCRRRAQGRARAKAKKHNREGNQGERVAVAVAVAIFMRTSNKHVFRPNLAVGVSPSASGKLVQQNTSSIRVGQRWETRLFLNLNAGMKGKGMGMWGRGRPEWSGRIKKTVGNAITIQRTQYYHKEDRGVPKHHCKISGSTRR